VAGFEKNIGDLSGSHQGHSFIEKKTKGQLAANMSKKIPNKIIDIV